MQFHDGKLVLASHNHGKLAEFQRLFSALGVSVVSAAELSLDEPEETGETFLANATLKAEAAAKVAQLPALADDSGLAVTGLDGAPGIYSARWAGPDRDFAVAFAKIAAALRQKGIEPEGAPAAFICVLVLMGPDGQSVTAEGRVSGRLTFTPRGNGGFGYDPIFIPDGETRTFAEMTAAEKAGYSHRMRAWEALAPKLAGTPAA